MGLIRSSGGVVSILSLRLRDISTESFSCKGLRYMCNKYHEDLTHL